ncbi:MAG TPA: TMEM165/GDT1 family protein [Candidatus Saccharimonadales bacterium]
MDISVIVVVFVVIFISELPDKSLLSSLILSSKYPARYVWLGAATAFLIHVLIAVSIGKALGLLPHNLLEAIVALVFLGGALILFFGKHGVDDELQKNSKHVDKTFNVWKLYTAAFGITFLGEWGDITQITTINYEAHYHMPWSVGIGALLALWSVTAIAVTFGAKAVNLVPAKVLQRVSATILLCFALVSAYQAIK